MTAGRPSKYQPEFCEKLVEHMASGLSFESFGATISVGRRTLYDWTDAHPEFYEAKDIGWVKGLHYWESLSQRAAEGLVQGFNATVWIFWMKNRFGWRDKGPEEAAEDAKRFERDRKAFTKETIEAMRAYAKAKKK